VAAARLAVAPDRCTVVEDSQEGVSAGRAAGMRVVGLAPRGNREALAEAGADPVFDSLRAAVPHLVSIGRA
jgi:sugar-phosphatase